MERNQMNSNRTTRSWGSIAATAFSLLSITVIVVVLGALAVGYRPVVITTGSMGDAAPVGSVIVAAPRAAVDIAPGDVLVMRRPGAAPITHRVLEIGDDGAGPFARTKGDANEDPDATAYQLGDEELVAQWVVPGLGSALQSLRDPRLLLGLLALGLIVATIVTLRVIWSDDERNNRPRRGHPASPVPPPPGSGRPLPPPVAAALRALAAGAADVQRCRWHQPSPLGGARFRNRNPHGMGLEFGADRGAGHTAPLTSGDPATEHPAPAATTFGSRVEGQLWGAP